MRLLSRLDGLFVNERNCPPRRSSHPTACALAHDGVRLHVAFIDPVPEVTRYYTVEGNAACCARTSA